MTDKNSFAYVSEKLGRVDSETRSIAQEVFEAAKKAGHAPWYMWGMGSSSEHATGNALDFMVRDKVDGDWIRNYLWDNRSRLRLRHVIWQQHITSAYTEPGKVRKMEDRGSVTENHMDHVHVLFVAGRYQPPNNVSVPAQKTIKQIASEVIQGKWSNYPARKHLLQKAGYDYNKVQAEVARQLKASGSVPAKKSVSTIATEVIAGKWGNGDERVKKLKAAGYDPKAVQAEVNRRV